MKRLFSVLVLVLFITGLLTAAAPLPKTTIALIGEGLPAMMNVGDQYTVLVEVTSDQPFLGVQAMPSFAYPGKGVVAVQGGERAAGGTFAHLEVTFKAKGSTAKMENGVAPVYVVVGVRYPGGYVVPQEYLFYVAVP
jgi:hypothetical protein